MIDVRRVDMHDSARFATWDVLTLNGTGYCEALISQLEKYNIAVCGVYN